MLEGYFVLVCHLIDEKAGPRLGKSGKSEVLEETAIFDWAP